MRRFKTRKATVAVAVTGAVMGAVLALWTLHWSAHISTSGPTAVTRVWPDVVSAAPLRLRGRGLRAPTCNTPDPDVVFGDGRAAKHCATVRVVGSDQVPIVNAQVRLLACLPGQPPKQLTEANVVTISVTGDSGYAIVKYPEDAVRWMVLAQAQGFHGAVAELSSEAGAEVLIELHPAREVRGIVRMPSGVPVAGLRVVAVAAGAPIDAPEIGLIPVADVEWAQSRTNSTGEFVLPLVGSGSCRIRVSEDGWHTVIEQEVSSADESETVELVAQPVRVVRFVPVDEVSGLPITIGELGIEARGDQVSKSNRAGTHVGMTLFTERGAIATGERRGSPAITLAVFFDEVPSVETIDVLLYWMTDLQIYMPTLAAVRLRKPGQVLVDGTSDRVRMRRSRDSVWTHALRLGEAFAGCVPAPAAIPRLFVFRADSFPGRVFVARGVKEGDTWLYSPMPTGGLKGEVHAGTVGVSNEIALVLDTRPIVETVALYVGCVGFSLELVDEDGVALSSPDLVLCTELDALGGAPRAPRTSIRVPASELQYAESGSRLVHCVPHAGFYRIAATRRGYTTDAVDIELGEGETEHVRLVLRRDPASR